MLEHAVRPTAASGDAPAHELWFRFAGQSDSFGAIYPGTYFAAPVGVYWRVLTQVPDSARQLERILQAIAGDGHLVGSRPADVGDRLFDPYPGGPPITLEEELACKHGLGELAEHDVRWIRRFEAPQDRRMRIKYEMAPWRERRAICRVRSRHDDDPRFSIGGQREQRARRSDLGPLTMLNRRHGSLRHQLDDSPILFATSNPKVMREHTHRAGGTILIHDHVIEALTDCGWGPKGSRLSAVEARDHYLGMSDRRQAYEALRVGIGDAEFDHHGFLSRLTRVLRARGLTDRTIFAVGVPLSMVASSFDDPTISHRWLQARSGVGIATAHRTISALVDDGLLAPTGETRFGTRYEIDVDDVTLDESKFVTAMADVASSADLHHLQRIVSLATGANNGALPFQWGMLHHASKTAPVTIDDLPDLWGWQRRTCKRWLDEGVTRGLWSIEGNHVIPTEPDLETSRKLDEFSTRRRDRQDDAKRRRREARAAWREARMAAVPCTIGTNGLDSPSESHPEGRDGECFEYAMAPKPPSIAPADMPPPTLQPGMLGGIQSHLLSGGEDVLRGRTRRSPWHGRCHRSSRE